MATLSIPDIMPIFPLPGTVLLPSEVLPLHIFEPRYREMVRDSLQSHRVIGMTMLKPGFEKDYEHMPAVNPVGCAGVIAQHQALPDGRYLIVLVGVQRFEIAEELPRPTLYRQVRVHHCPEHVSAEEKVGLQTLRQNLVDQLPEILHRLRGEQIESTALARLDDNQLIAVATQVLQVTPTEKQTLLESDSLVDRYIALHEALEVCKLAIGNPAKGRDRNEIN